MNLDPNTSLAMMQATQSGAFAKAENARHALKGKDLEKIEAAAKDFEAMFVTEMMKPMFEQIKPDPTFGGGKGEEIFQGMMLEEYGKMMAETGQLGIADSLKREMIRMQEEASNMNAKQEPENATKQN